MISGAGSFIADKISDNAQGDRKATQYAKTRGDVVAPSNKRTRGVY